MARRKTSDPLSGFRKSLAAAGAEILAATNPYEALRFRSLYGVGVIYIGKGGQKWTPEAVMAKDHLKAGNGSLAPVTVRGRRTDRATVNRLFERDGKDCFFCGTALAEDVTVEHLVSIAHGGPNHIANLFLAHQNCNQDAGHMSAPEKIKMAIRKRLK